MRMHTTVCGLTFTRSLIGWVAPLNGRKIRVFDTKKNNAVRWRVKDMDAPVEYAADTTMLRAVLAAIPEIYKDHPWTQSAAQVISEAAP